MKIIELRTVTPEVGTLLDNARSDDVIVRLTDGTEFLLVAVDDFDHEVVRTRSNQKLMEFLESRAMSTAAVPIGELKQRLRL